MNRIKVSNNFYADEFLNPYLYFEIWQRGGDELIKRYLNPVLINLAQQIRTLHGGSATINNWWAHHEIVQVGSVKTIIIHGDPFINSGLRFLSMPHKKGSLSRHYFNMALDLKFGVKAKTVYDEVILPNLHALMHKGLTAVEDIDKTVGQYLGWLHISIEYTGSEHLVVINP